MIYGKSKTISSYFQSTGLVQRTKEQNKKSCEEVLHGAPFYSFIYTVYVFKNITRSKPKG
jgi:hypothetical protein